MAPPLDGISGSLGPLPRAAGVCSIDGRRSARLGRSGLDLGCLCIGVLCCCLWLDRQSLLSWLRRRSCPASSSPPCSGEGVACVFRDGVPANAPEPDSSSRPPGRAYMRSSKPFGDGVCRLVDATHPSFFYGCSGEEKPAHGGGVVVVEDAALCTQDLEGLRCKICFSGVVCEMCRDSWSGCIQCVVCV